MTTHPRRGARTAAVLPGLLLLLLLAAACSRNSQGPPVTEPEERSIAPFHPWGLGRGVAWERIRQGTRERRSLRCTGRETVGGWEAWRIVARSGNSGESIYHLRITGNRLYRRDDGTTGWEPVPLWDALARTLEPGPLDALHERPDWPPQRRATLTEEDGVWEFAGEGYEGVLRVEYSPGDTAQRWAPGFGLVQVFHPDPAVTSWYVKAAQAALPAETASERPLAPYHPLASGHRWSWRSVDGADTATVVQEVLAPASAYGIAGFELARRSTAEPAQDDTVLAALTHNRRLTLDPELRIWLADTLWLHLASTPEPGLVFTAGDSGRGAEGRLLAVDTSVVAGGTTYGGVLAWSLHRWGALPDSTIGSWYDIRYYAPEVGLVLRDRIRVTGTGRDSSRTELLEFRPGGAGVGPGGQAPRTGPRLHGRASLAPR